MWRRIFLRCLSTTTTKNLKISNINKVTLIQLNRPHALNSLNSELMSELQESLSEIDRNDSLSAVVLTGDLKSFAAGADIEEMSKLSYIDVYKGNFLANWSSVAKFRKPIIAAVNGFALGGGFELALMCDIIYAGKNSKFGLPEIKLGTIPGGGGTQRLIRAIGKSSAMELTLTGRHFNSSEAHRLGIVSRVFDDEIVVDESIKLAEEISKFSLPALLSCKEAILTAQEVGISVGLEYERKAFHSTFALDDKSEGMNSFLAKRKPKFNNK